MKAATAEATDIINTFIDNELSKIDGTKTISALQITKIAGNVGYIGNIGNLCKSLSFVYSCLKKSLISKNTIFDAEYTDSFYSAKVTRIVPE